MKTLKKIAISQKIKNSFILQQVQKANNLREEIQIKHNTHAWNGKFNSIKPEDRFREKTKKIAVLARNAKWVAKPNGRSTDFLPNLVSVQGCSFGCAYCYTDRNYLNNYPKIYEDALKVVDMIKTTMDSIDFNRSVFIAETGKKGFEFERDSKHKKFVTFDLGCDSDCVLDNKLTKNKDYYGHVIDIMNQCSTIPHAMTSFATKSAEIHDFISYVNKPSHHRIRISLMPEKHRKLVELNTSTIKDRLEAVNKLVNAGFEVHINLSPIILTKDFIKEYRALLEIINFSLSNKAKKQLAYEIIFLTHSDKMNDPIKKVMPKAHNLIYKDNIPLVPKNNKPNVISYSAEVKQFIKKELLSMIKEITPYSRVRYIF